MAHDSPSIESIYDFVYINRDKLASYSAQIFEHGVLSTVSSSDENSNSATSKRVSGFKTIYQATADDSAISKQSISQNFDASWVLPLNVLNRLDEIGAIRRDLKKVKLGDLVLIEGSLRILDLGMMRNVWEPMSKIINFGEANNNITAAKKRSSLEHEAKSKLAGQILHAIPSTIQMRIYSNDSSIFQAWGNLRPEFMVGDAGEYTLMHGAHIPGVWHCLAVVNNKPFRTDDPELKLSRPLIEPELASGMLKMSEKLRELIGRQPFEFGVTPIAIFKSNNFKQMSLEDTPSL